MRAKKYDWLGLCLEMMTDYFPVETHSRSDGKKYWNISEHLLCIMAHSGLIKNKELDKRNYLIREIIRKFAMSNTYMFEDIEHNTNADIEGNIVLNNILIFSMMD